jgi:hypothetical protein
MASSQDESRFPLHIDRNHLPEPEWEFPNAHIEMYATNSTPDFPPTKQAPEGSPYILLVLLDDVPLNLVEAKSYPTGASCS